MNNFRLLAFLELVVLLIVLFLMKSGKGLLE